PSRGLLSQVRLVRVFNGPDIVIDGQPVDLQASYTQLSGTATRFWSRGPRNRLFATGGIGGTLDGTPLPNDQFAIGDPFKLGAYQPNELKNEHFYATSDNYLRNIGQLPDFMGGPVFASAWLENADAFDD